MYTTSAVKLEVSIDDAVCPGDFSPSISKIKFELSIGDDDGPGGFSEHGPGKLELSIDDNDEDLIAEELSSHFSTSYRFASWSKFTRANQDPPR